MPIVDLSGPSERAFGYGLALAERTGATLHAFHAWPSPFWFPVIGSPLVGGTAQIESTLDSWRRSAERVMCISTCPVLVVPERVQLPPRPPLRKIVVAVDFSPAARRALGLALRLGEALGRPQIVVLYAHYVPLEIETILGGEVAQALDVHGHVSLGAGFLGRVAERVVRTAPCPLGSVA